MFAVRLLEYRAPYSCKITNSSLVNAGRAESFGAMVSTKGTHDDGKGRRGREGMGKGTKASEGGGGREVEAAARRNDRDAARACDVHASPFVCRYFA